MRFPDTVAILRAAGTDAYGNPGASWDTPETVATVAGFFNGKRDTCYLPATARNPRPYGMPPFAQVLDDASIAAVVSYIRNAWGNRAEPVSQLQVMRAR